MGAALALPRRAMDQYAGYDGLLPRDTAAGTRFRHKARLLAEFAKLGLPERRWG
ncbi:hypothetical protein OG302_42845 [Streptomyces sp. NBC_01283]|uniref:hypothetical protein n=1 Tax=Streptomyces sp. NBC_01283 TaxID=2903812 RepID=UPI00352BDA90|nr:hypothetical protein OG302_42845 [Streptomyces sp. NBC_01283]